jgi:hypothetical protein
MEISIRLTQRSEQVKGPKPCSSWWWWWWYSHDEHVSLFHVIKNVFGNHTMALRFYPRFARLGLSLGIKWAPSWLDRPVAHHNDGNKLECSIEGMMSGKALCGNLPQHHFNYKTSHTDCPKIQSWNPKCSHNSEDVPAGQACRTLDRYQRDIAEYGCISNDVTPTSVALEPEDNGDLMRERTIDAMCHVGSLGTVSDSSVTPNLGSAEPQSSVTL